MPVGRTKGRRRLVKAAADQGLHRRVEESEATSSGSRLAEPVVVLPVGLGFGLVH